MLEEQTELWVESVWNSMSERFRNKVAAAVDTGLMIMTDEGKEPPSVMKGLTGDLLEEAKFLCGEDGVLEEIPLGKHALESPSKEQGNFRIGDELHAYVLVRVLL